MIESVFHKVKCFQWSPVRLVVWFSLIIEEKEFFPAQIYLAPCFSILVALGPVCLCWLMPCSIKLPGLPYPYMNRLTMNISVDLSNRRSHWEDQCLPMADVGDVGPVGTAVHDYWHPLRQHKDCYQFFPGNFHFGGKLLQHISGKGDHLTPHIGPVLHEAQQTTSRASAVPHLNRETPNRSSFSRFSCKLYLISPFRTVFFILVFLSLFLGCFILLSHTYA